jgi:hypothetical protein
MLNGPAPHSPHARCPSAFSPSPKSILLSALPLFGPKYKSPSSTSAFAASASAGLAAAAAPRSARTLGQHDSHTTALRPSVVNSKMLPALFSACEHPQHVMLAHRSHLLGPFMQLNPELHNLHRIAPALNFALSSAVNCPTKSSGPVYDDASPAPLSAAPASLPAHIPRKYPSPCPTQAPD